MTQITPSEEQAAIREGERNDAESVYFQARPGLDGGNISGIAHRVFCDGFDRGYQAAIAPLLQDLAAHEASNRIKTENLETLREQNGKMREALKNLENATRFSKVDSYRERLDLQSAIEAARAALGESDE